MDSKQVSKTLYVLREVLVSILTLGGVLYSFNSNNNSRSYARLKQAQ